MAGQWRPIKDTHAIDMIAFVVQYPSPLPSLLLSKLLQIVSSHLKELGLVNSRPTDGMAIDLRPDGPPVATRTSSGMEFWSGSREFDEKVAVDGHSIIYRIRRFMPWADQSERLGKVLAPALEMLSEVTVPAVLRLEYLDRFWFDGKFSEADPSLLLNAKSKNFSSHILNRRSLWHSHTGAFLSSNDPYPHVLQINIDALDVALDEARPEAVRAVHIMTAREDRLSMGPVDTRHASPQFILSWANTAHGELKPVLSDILHSTMVDRIGLAK